MRGDTSVDNNGFLFISYTGVSGYSGFWVPAFASITA
jgi:hypothetical protein